MYEEYNYIIEASLSTTEESLLYIVIETPNLALMCILLRSQITRSTIFIHVIFCTVQQTLRDAGKLSHRHFLWTEGLGDLCGTNMRRISIPLL